MKINKITISEKLMYSTVLICTDKNVGTGFFFEFDTNNNEKILTIVTNYHIINQATKEIKFSVHLSDDSTFEITKLINKNEKLMVLDEQNDLCIIDAGFVTELLKKKGKILFKEPLREANIPSVQMLKNLSMIEDVTMVGYPNAIIDMVNFFPIFRKGITATHPCIDFNGQKKGVADIACFPGSSGSPIFILNELGYTDKFYNTVMGNPRFYFIGINCSSFTMTSLIKDKNGIPHEQESESKFIEFLNTSLYTKSSVLLEHKVQVIETFSRQ